MPKHDYIFVDESGDPAYTVDQISGLLLSSDYYIVAALHLCDDSFSELNEHVASFRYFSGLNRELKIPKGRQEFSRLLEPLKARAEGGKHIWASVVYVDKKRYTGGYLKAGQGRPPDATRFRNYMLRRLLEHHFQSYDLQSEHYDLVLDRVEMRKDQVENLQEYISRNYNIPTPTHITHASSIYVEGLQIVHHIANGYKDVVGLGYVPSELSFVQARDLTRNQYI